MRTVLLSTPVSSSCSSPLPRPPPSTASRRPPSRLLVRAVPGDEEQVTPRGSTAHWGHCCWPASDDLSLLKAKPHIDASGAGRTWASPQWLTQLNQLWGKKGVSSSLQYSLPSPRPLNTHITSSGRTSQWLMQSQMTSRTCLVEPCSKLCTSG